MHSIGPAGFERPIPPRQARQRTTLALIATAALALSTAIAATVVSIEIARAEMVGGSAAGEDHFALALFLGVVLAGMGGLTAVMTLQRNGKTPKN